MTSHIRDIDIGNTNDPDFPVWNSTEDDTFSIKSAWHLLREHKPKNNLLNKVWHPKIPFKISFLT